MLEEEITEKIKELPDDVKKELLDYIEFLIGKYTKEKGKVGFRFEWEGSLSGLKDKINSVELQHKASEWR